MFSLSALVTCRHPSALGTGIMHGCCSFSAAHEAWRTTNCCACACLVAAGRWQASPLVRQRMTRTSWKELWTGRFFNFPWENSTWHFYPASSTGWIPNLWYSLPSALNHYAALQTKVFLSNCHFRLHGWLILWNLTAFLLSPFQRRQAWWTFPIADCALPCCCFFLSLVHWSYWLGNLTTDAWCSSWTYGIHYAKRHWLLLWVASFLFDAGLHSYFFFAKVAQASIVKYQSHGSLFLLKFSSSLPHFLLNGTPKENGVFRKICL